jgi:hypothetical protein
MHLSTPHLVPVLSRALAPACSRPSPRRFAALVWRLFAAFAFASLSPFAAADTLQPLGDEFDNAATFSRYQEHGALEGWGSSHIESADINTTSPGHFRVVPTTTGWYEHLRGTHFSKNVTGDFVVTARVFVYSRQNPAGPLAPSVRLYSLGGILLREPRPITHAAPVPYTTAPVWPPQNFGSDWTPGDETWANTSELVGKGENYLFLSLGTAGNSGTRQFEIKTTRRSRSELYFSSNGVGGSREAWLQMVRVGNTVVCLRRHSAAGPWVVENRYPNPDHAFPQFGPTLQVGITAYTDFNSIAGYEAGGPQTQFNANYITIPGAPDLILDVDYLRIQRPDPALTEAVLQAMATSYNPATNQTANPPVALAASPVAAPYLGDNADIALGGVAFSVAALNVGERDASAVLTVTRTGNNTALPLTLQFTTANGTATAGSDFTATSGSLVWAPGDSVSKSIIVPLLGDAAVEEAEQFTVVLSGLDGPATFPASAPTLTATVTIADSPFHQWRAARFGASANLPEAQALADPDADGVPNLLEYALGGEPLSGGDAGTPACALDNVTRRLQLTYTRHRPDLDYTVESTTDLLTWTALATNSGPLATETTVVDPVPLSPESPRRFLRLRVAER